MAGFERGETFFHGTISAVKEMVDIVQLTSQTTRRESIAWFCLEQPELPKDFVEALKNG